MKSFLRNVVQRKDSSGGGLVGRTVKVGPYTVRVEAHLADGGFASIYRVRDGSTGTAYAMKHMRLMGDQEAITDCMTEVNALKKLRDVPSVLTLRAAAFTGTKGNEQEAYLILDLCQDNLVEYMRGHDNKLSTPAIIQIFSAVCQAVAAMHWNQPPLAHRDLKAENVLQHSNGDWVLCDFGSVTDKPALYESTNAVLMGEEVMRKYTTPAYRAPEMWDLYSRERIDTKADIWALGCLLYYLLFGKLAFQAEAKLQILNGDISVPPSRPPPLIALLRELLVVNPAGRPDIIAVLRRLQEVAEALNVDPALLVPRNPTPPASSRRQEPQAAANSLSRQSSAVPLSRQSSAVSPAAPPPPAAASPPVMPPVPSSAVPPAAPAHRSNSFTRAPPSVSQMAPEVSKPEPEKAATFDQAAPLFQAPPSAPDEGTPKLQGSTPWSQRSMFNWQQRETAGEGSPPFANPELVTLRKQAADMQQQHQQLLATIRSQQSTIKQLQVDNYNMGLQLKRLGLDPVPSVVALPAAPQPAPAPAAEPGWANFDSPPSGSPPRQPSLAPVRTPSFHASEPGSARGSPGMKQRLSNGSIARPQSPQLSGALAGGSGFDPFGIQSPSTEPGSQNDTPSETMSRHSALSAFAESLKQPALVGDADADTGSPASDSSRQQEGNSSKPHKSKRLHRRSSSEPVPIENWNLVEER